MPSLTVIGHNKLTIFCSKLQIHVSHLHIHNTCNENSDRLQKKKCNKNLRYEIVELNKIA